MPMKCPGQDKRYWRSEDLLEIACPHCGKSSEFWKDDPHRRCKHCGQDMTNPNFDLGCAKWCKYARECFGLEPPSAPADDKET